MNPSLRQQLDAVTEAPGCYLYRNAQGKIIYVGKALNLRRRVFQYFQAQAKLTPKNRVLVGQIEHLETVVVGTELEALILEENLIKKHRPRYNVLLRDDKRYPYLQLTTSEAYPRLLVTRRPYQSKDKYYGPFVHVAAMRETLRLVHRNLGIRQCDIEIDRKLPKPCLYYDLHQCDAPCVNWGESQEQYGQHVKQAQWLLEGKENTLLDELSRRMQAASESEKFEEAARWRDSLKAIELVRQRQRVVLGEPKDVDVVALATAEAEGGEKLDGAVKVFFIRGGKLIDWQDCRLANIDPDDAGAALQAFVQQFYAGAAAVPQEVLLSHAVDEPEVLRDWLSMRRGTRVDLTVPQRGQKSQLLKLVETNAREMLKDDVTRFGERKGEAVQGAGKDIEGGLEELKKVLGLSERAPAHRRLRHLAFPGQPDRGLDGGDAGWASRQGSVPEIQGEERGRGG